MTEAIATLKKTPYNSKEHQKALEAVKKQTDKKYPNQYVLAYEREYFNFAFRNDMIMSSDENLKALMDTVIGIDDYQAGGFKERSEVEHNLKWKQLNTFTLIHDGVNALVLCKADNDVLTLAGGHVDYEQQAIFKPVGKIIERSARREIVEEISFKEPISFKDIRLKKLALFNTNNDWNKILHACMCYEWIVEDVKKLKASSGEKKHSVKIMNMESILTDKKTDPWLKQAVKLTLNKIKKSKNIAVEHK